MPRRGSFGRVPRSGTDLSSTLISIARQMRSQDDSNIMDAWKSGGQFQGHPVTDEQVLAHWKERLGGVSKDDPLYDTYKNAYTQYNYAIEESKVSTLYAQGKLSAQGVANFYLGWAKRSDVPRGSEFYRVLQRDAAQFMRSAAASGRAGAARGKDQAYNDALTNIHQKHEAAGEYLTSVLTTMAQLGNAGQGVPRLLDSPGSNSNLTQFNSSDPEQMQRLISLITPMTQATISDGLGSGPDLMARPTSNVVYNDPITHKPVTGIEIANTLMKLLPSYHGGALTVRTFNDALASKVDGIQQRIALATKEGKLKNAKSFTNELSYYSELGREVRAWPITVSYEHLRSAANLVLNGTSFLPQQKQEAFHEYQVALLNLASDPRIATDDLYRNALINEANQVPGTVTIDESFTQTGHDQPSTKISQVEETKARMAAIANDIALIAKDPVNYVYTTGAYSTQPGNLGEFIPLAGGDSLGITLRDKVDAISAGRGDPQVFFVATGGGPPVPVVVVGMPITATARIATGKTVSFDNTLPVGSVYQITLGGVKTETVGFDVIDKSGKTVRMYTSLETPPWAGSVFARPSRDGGYVLDLTSVLKPGAAGFTLRGATPATAKSPGNPGTIFMDPKAAALGSDTVQVQAGGGQGYDPLTTFFSPTLAGLMGMPDGQEILHTLQKDPAFMQSIEYEAYTAAGGRVPLSDPSWRQATDMDPALYSQFITQAELAGQGRALPNDRSSTAPFHLPNTTGGPDERQQVFTPDATARAATPVTGRADDRGALTLPMDQLHGTAFAAMGTGTTNGTNNLFQGKAADDSLLSIKAKGALTVPGLPAIFNQNLLTVPKPTTAEGPLLRPFYEPPVPTLPGSATPTPPQVFYPGMTKTPVAQPKISPGRNL